MSNRVFYAVQAVGFAQDGLTNYIAARGLNSVGITTSFNLEALLELGQLELYVNYEKIPQVEVTLEKKIDGYPLLLCLATQGAANASLTGRGIPKCTVGLSIYDDTQQSASGTPIAGVYMSGLFFSNISYSLPLDGECTEQITLVGNHKQWLTVAASGNPATLFSASFLNTDSPLAGNGSGQVQHRQNVLFTPTVNTLDSNGYVADEDCTILPGGTNGIPGITSSGTNPLTGPNSSHAAHIQSINVSCNTNREDLLELGKKFPFFKFISFPVEVTTEISVLTTQGDQVSATQDGVIAGDGRNLNNASIRVALKEGTRINLGTNNKLTSSSITGGDTGGGNSVTTYTFINYNSLKVTHPQDPTASLAYAATAGIGGL